MMAMGEAATLKCNKSLIDSGANLLLSPAPAGEATDAHGVDMVTVRGSSVPFTFVSVLVAPVFLSCSSL